MPEHGEFRESDGRWYCEFCATGGANGVNRRDIQRVWKRSMTAYIVHEGKLSYSCNGCAREAGPVEPWIRNAVKLMRRQVGAVPLRAALLKGVDLEVFKKGDPKGLKGDTSPLTPP